MPQLMGVAGEETYKGAWLDIYVDFQGPFPESVDGLRLVHHKTLRINHSERSEGTPKQTPNFL